MVKKLRFRFITINGLRAIQLEWKFKSKIWHENENINKDNWKIQSDTGFFNISLSIQHPNPSEVLSHQDAIIKTQNKKVHELNALASCSQNNLQMYTYQCTRKPGYNQLIWWQISVNNLELKIKTIQCLSPLLKKGGETIIRTIMKHLL